MNILIRADSSSQIGLGHIMRDLVLAEQFDNDSVMFACRELPGNIIHKIPYPVHTLATDSPQELIDMIQVLRIDMIVFDHYGIDSDFEQTIKDATGISVFSVDDTYQKHHCDILLNPNIYADKSRYAALVPRTCDIRCGQEFLLIRKEFLTAKDRAKPPSEAVFVSMGGSDPKNLSMEVLKALPEHTPVHLVTTSANPHLNDLREYASSHPDIKLHIDTSNMADLMLNSRFAIITPSTITHEVMTIGLPFIAIQSASNQSEFVDYLKTNGYPVLDRFELSNFQMLLEKVLTRLVAFNDMTPEESEMVLDWRNRPQIRSVMYTDQLIGSDEHARFVASLQKQNTKRYFLVYFQDDPIGVIDFTDIGDTVATIGLYADPDTYRPGKGSVLMRCILDYGKNTLGVSHLIAECFSDNLRAKHLYEKFDFRETSRSTYKEREVIHMEYSYDHRQA